MLMALHGDECECPVLLWFQNIKEEGRLSRDGVSEMVRSDLDELELDESILKDIVRSCVRTLRAGVSEYLKEYIKPCDD